MSDRVKTCSPGVGQDDYHIGLKRLLLTPYGDEFKAYTFEDVGEFARAPLSARDPTIEEAEEISIGGGEKFDEVVHHLKKIGAAGICYETDTATKEAKFFAYAKLVNRGDFLALHNKCEPKASGLSFDMHPDEVKGLAALKEVRLAKADICCKEGFCPTFDASTQQYTKGSYIWTANYALLTELTEIVKVPSWFASLILREKKVEIEGLTDDRRAEFVEYLEKQIQAVNAQVDAAENSSIWTPFLVIGVIAFGIPSTIALWPQVKNVLNKMKLENFTEELKRKLAKNPDYGFKNREAEAREVLKTLKGAKPRVIIEGVTGSGKDILFKEIALLVLKGDEAVPERWRGASSYVLSPLEVQAGTFLRGTVADKIKAMISLAKKGPVVVYMPEIDLVLLSGATSDGEGGTQDTEMPSNLLLRELTDNPVVRENLLLIGSTSRGDKLKRRDAELNIVRRFWWHSVHVPTLGEVVQEIAEGFVTKAEIEGNYDVRLSNEVIDLAARIAEQYYRKMDDSGVLGPRFDAIIDLLESASSSANDRKAKDVTSADVLAAIKKLRGVELSEAEVSELKGRDIDSLMIDESTPIARYAERLKTIRGVAEKMSQLPDEARLEIARSLFERWRTLDPVARGNLIGAELLIGGGKPKDGQPTDGFTRLAFADIIKIMLASQRFAGEAASDAEGADSAGESAVAEAIAKMVGAGAGGETPEESVEKAARVVDFRDVRADGSAGESGDPRRAAEDARRAAGEVERAADGVRKAGEMGREAAKRR